MEVRYFLISCILALQGAAFSQNAYKTVNRKEVEKLVSNKSASTYYPKLLKRFLSDDTTLTGDECRLLYYGFAFQEEYSGYPDLKMERINEAMSNEDYELVINLCDSVLSRYPINLFATYKKGLALYSKNKNDPTIKKCKQRYRKIINAIVSSGDGLTCKTAFKIIFINDEYFVMYRHFEIEKFKSQTLESPCDKMSIAPSETFKSNAMYFDTSETLLFMERL